MSINTVESAAISADLRQEVEDFLLGEAALLDGGDFERWLQLFTEQSRYWIPLRRGAAAPDDELNIVYDDFNRIRDRINRITGGDAHSQDPPSATSRLLGRVRVSESRSAWPNSPASKWVAQANFSLVELRRDIQTLYVGMFTYGLLRCDAGLRLVAKRVDLLNSESPLGNLTIIL